MFKNNGNRKAILGDVIIGLGILALAIMFKDANAESQAVAMCSIFAAVIIRVSGAKSSIKACATTAKCK